MDKPRDVPPKIDVGKYDEILTECITAESPSSEASVKNATPNGETTRHLRFTKLRQPSFRLLIILIAFNLLAITAQWLVNIQIPKAKTSAQSFEELKLRFGAEASKVAAALELAKTAGEVTDYTSERFERAVETYNQEMEGRDKNSIPEDSERFIPEQFDSRGNGVYYNNDPQQ